VLPEEDMPFLPDGTPVDMILNPLGVPSRMNIGQILETHLGLVAAELGHSFENPIFEGATDKEILEYFQVTAERYRRRALRKYVQEEMRLPAEALPAPHTRRGDPPRSLDSRAGGSALRLRSGSAEGLPYEDMKAALAAWLSDPAHAAELERAAEWMALPDPEESKVEESKSRRSNLDSSNQRAAHVVDRISQRVDEGVGFDPATGKYWLYDGRSGERFNQPITVGYIYTMKLIHLVDDKIHARSTGPYSLVTQQPLGGKAQFGGQRFGEMEVWALEAYGAAHTLQEILTIKSDDVLGRVKTYEAVVKGEPIMEPGIPESFKILIKELQSLGLQLTVESAEAEPVSLDGQEGEGALA